MYTLEEKLAIIESSNSFADLNIDVLPKAHKEDYYFVSYSHKDYKEVMKDILLLEDAGINIWYDSDMHIGENWEDIAEMYISKFQCKGIIFYLTKNSILSPACNKEVEFVLQNNKQFFSINLPLNSGEDAQSGLSMLLQLKKEGANITDELISNFEKAFSDKMLFLPYSDSIQRKKEQISKLVGEEVFIFSHEYHPSLGNSSKLCECRDNAFIRLDLKNNYQVNDPEDKDFGEVYPLRVIDKCAFANSFKLTDINLPEQIYEIDEYAFVNCFKLKNINLGGGSLCYIRDHAFSRCKNLDIDKIYCNFLYKYSFSDCTSLKELQLKVNQIGACCFSGCSSLKSIEFLKQPITISGYAFRKCKSLSKITFPNAKENEILATDQLLAFEENCFAECDGLEQITFSGKIDLSKAISLLEYCKNLKSVTFNLATPLKTLKRNFFTHCRNLTEVVGLDGVKVFEEDCFYECNNLKNINLEKAVEIHTRAFACTALEQVCLPSVKRVEKYAFAVSDSITKVVIGEQLKELGSKAFYQLENLKEIEIYSKDFTFEWDSFFEVSTEKLTVCNLDFLFDFIQNRGENLKVVYVESGLVSARKLNGLKLYQFKKVKSDKDGFDKFTVGKCNKYGGYIGSLLFVTFSNFEQNLVFCEDAGYDEERGEFYILSQEGEKFYESDIHSISKTYSF